MVVTSAAMLLGVWMWLASGQFTALAIDQHVNAGFGRLAAGSAGLVGVARGLSYLGVAGVVVGGTAVTALVLVRRGARWLAVWMVAVVTIGWLATEIVKLVVGRTRPPTNGEYWTARGFSFPSGHASVGVYAFGALAVVLAIAVPGRQRWWWSVGVAVVGLAIGVSRLVLGVHWISDVVAGWALGLLVLSVGVILLQRSVSPPR